VVVVSNAAAPLPSSDVAPVATAAAAAAPSAAAAAVPAKAPAPAPQPKTAAVAAAAAAPAAAAAASFSAYTLSAAQATLSPDPASNGLATLVLKGLSNSTIPRGSAGVLSGALHTPKFLAASFPAGATVELRGSAAAGGGGDWGSCYLRKVTLIASGAAEGVAVLSGVVAPASLGDAGQAMFGTQRGTLVFNRVSVLVTAQRLVAAAPSPSAAPAAAATAPSSAAAPAKSNATAATAPKVSVAAATRPVASVKSVPLPSEFSN